MKELKTKKERLDNLKRKRTALTHVIATFNEYYGELEMTEKLMLVNVVEMEKILNNKVLEMEGDKY